MSISNIKQVTYRGYVGTCYSDTMCGETYWNFEITKDDCFVMHATIIKEMNETEMYEFLKRYVDRRMGK